MGDINSVRFTCTALLGTNKVGNLKKDSDGYYETVIGGLNVYNSIGHFYTANDAKQLFESSGLLMRRIQRGRLHGEYGHPKQMPGESDRDFTNRMFMINEDKISHHFKEVWLDFDSVKDPDGNKIVAIMAKLIPSGPYGSYLEKSLNNPSENVSFSIRAFTDDNRVRGVTYRSLKTIVTWDFVQSPGISAAEKFSSPSLESYVAQELDSRIVTRKQLELAACGKEREAGGLILAQESDVMNISELMTSMGWNTGSRPAFRKW